MQSTAEEMIAATDDPSQERRLKVVHEVLDRVAEVDMEKNGPTPEDKLVALIESADECLLEECDEPVDDAGFCRFQHMMDFFEEEEAHV